MSALSSHSISTGIGLRSPHIAEFLETKPAIDFVEVHSENYFADGGIVLTTLQEICDHYPLSLHGVGLSLGRTDNLDANHLRKLKRLVDRFEPQWVSDHICWGALGDRYANDLLPLPYTDEALNILCDHISYTQDYLGRTILIENVSSYLSFAQSEIPEWEFVSAAAQKTGCGILLDINNIYVNAKNHALNATAYIDHIPSQHVEEIHLAGFTDNGLCLIDTHGNPVCDAVWDLYRYAMLKLGNKATLIEWDTDIPALDILLAEAKKASDICVATISDVALRNAQHQPTLV